MSSAQMPRISNTPYRGTATVKKGRDKATGQPAWVVTGMSVTTDKGKEVLPDFAVAAAQAPAYLRSGTWGLTVQRDKSKILEAIPDAAIVIAEFSNLVSKKDGTIFLKISPSKYNSSIPWVQFAIIWKVVEGEYKDLEIVDWVNYNFAGQATPDDPDRLVTGLFPASGKATDALAMRIDALGIIEKFGLIPWSGDPITWGGATIPGMVNILPKIAKRSRKVVEEDGRKVQLSIIGGRVVQVKHYTGDDDVDLMGEDEETEVNVSSEVAPEVTPKSEPAPSDDDPDIMWDDNEE